MTTMTLRSLAILALSAAAACGDAPPPRAAARSPMQDSVRVRTRRRLDARPDTLIARVDTGRALGAPTARLWVVFVGQLQCAPCASSLHALIPMIRREYVETGKIRFAYVNAGAPDTVYNARFAAHAALCAGLSGHFWEALDLIAASRDDWADLDDPQPRLDSLAVRAGADPATQSMCRQRQNMLAMVMWDKERAEASNITQLPTLLVGDQPFTGDLSPAAVRRAIDKALASLQ